MIGIMLVAFGILWFVGLFALFFFVLSRGEGGIYYDHQGLPYVLTGETRQVSGGEDYLEDGQVQICKLIGCFTDESYPVLRGITVQKP